MEQAPPHKRHRPASDKTAGRKAVMQTGSTAARPAAKPAATAQRRFGAIQIGICVLFFVEGLWGLYLVGWPALSLCVLGAMYMVKVARRRRAPQGSGKR